MKFLCAVLFLLLFSETEAQILGCTDPGSTNFNAKATLNDGSCAYKDKRMKPLFSRVLDAKVNETSGLIYWDKNFLTINDDTDTSIRVIDENSGKILTSYALPGVENRDWEEISQDSAFIYIGNFGNNVNANSQKLHILKIDKKSLLLKKPVIDTIHFSYADQADFSIMKSNKTNFDGEAFIISSDSIFIFTKQWKARKTSVYGLPNQKGKHIAQLKSTYDVNGLITGATFLPDEKIVVLSGYSKFQMPFIYLLYDFKNNDFFSGNKRKVKLRLPFRQIEGIAHKGDFQFYLTNEEFHQWPILNHRAKLHKIDLSDFFIDYRLAKKK